MTWRKGRAAHLFDLLCTGALRAADGCPQAVLLLAQLLLDSIDPVVARLYCVGSHDEHVAVFTRHGELQPVVLILQSRIHDGDLALEGLLLVVLQ